MGERITEKTTKRSIRLALGRKAVLFENNVGIAQYPDGSVVPYGLCKGSSDLIGWRSFVITADMVGKTVAQFVAIEVKSEKGAIRPKQITFVNNVRAAGGAAGFARSVQDAEEILKL